MTDASAPATGQTPDTAPVVRNERIASLDFIRGLAVMGILVANIVAFGQPFSAYLYPGLFVGETGDPDGWLWITQFVLIDGKMRGLFTLLFGAGLFLFMERAWARGQSRWLQVRRLLWLMAFGLVHYFLIWRGDILFLYSVAGLVAMLFLRWSARNQIVFGLLGYFGGALLYTLFFGPAYFVAETDLREQPGFAEFAQGLDEGKTEDFAMMAQETEVLTNGSYLDYIAYNWTEHAESLSFILFLFMFETLPLMLIGMALYRFGLFSGGMDPGVQVRRGLGWLVVGLSASLLIAFWVQSTGFSYWATISALTALSALPKLATTLGLALLLGLWGQRVSGWLAQRISAAGRAAFTNYLGTSVLMLLVFHPWAGGLWGDLNRPQLYLVVLATWVVMLLWSKPWLDRFHYGPLEWLWRCLTYWRLFPLLRIEGR